MRADILTAEQKQQAIRQVVFRDFRFTLTSYEGIEYLTVNRPCVLRENDNKFPHDKYYSVGERRKWDEDEAYSHYHPDNRYLPHRKTTENLAGSYPVPKKVDLHKFLQFVLRCAATIEMHEFQENFYYGGKRIFDPHVIGEFLSGGVHP